MATFTELLVANLGYSGQATNVRATVYDSAGTIQIAATNNPTGSSAFAEETDAAGNATTGIYRAPVTLNTDWLPVRVKYTLVGYAGVAVDEVISALAARIAAGAITAASIATDAIDADALAADAVAEIQSGLSTLTAAGIRAAVGLATANLDTQLVPLSVVPYVSGSVNDAAATTGQFIAAAGLSAVNDFYNGCLIVATSGASQGICRAVSDYVGATRTFAFTGAAGQADAPWPAALANGVTFIVLGRSE